METEPITKAALHPGDILLCRIPALPFRDYLSSIWQVVSHFVARREFDLEAATPLIHWIIGYLDEGHHFHASFWNGSRVVESRIKTGLRANDIATYANDDVDVFRYRKDGRWLGPSPLPVAPLLQKAQELVDRHWRYGFDSAFLLAILCVSRWHRAEWVDRIRDLLVRHAPFDWLGQEIGRLVDEHRPQIDALIEKLIAMALEVVRQYRQREGYVCSQAVAVIYNEAGDAGHPVGTYALPKPSHALRAAPVALVAPPAADDEAACERGVRELGEALARLPAAPAALLTAADQRDYDTLQAHLRADTFYTPRDLAESSRTVLVGRLDLAGRAAAERGASG